MGQFRKKPVVIEAFQWEPGCAFPAPAFNELPPLARIVGDDRTPDEHYLAIQTLEGTMRANPGDWIIKGVKGEFYPCKPDIFEATYEAV